MKKRIITLILIMVFAVSISACGKSNSESNRKDNINVSKNTGKDNPTKSPSDSQNETADNSASGTEGGSISPETTLEDAVDSFLEANYPKLKEMRDKGLIGINADPKDTITLGKWDCEFNGAGDGNDEDLEWEVLEYSEDGKSALVLSKYVICDKKFNEENGDVTWESSTIRKWLNDEFYKNAFSSEEQALIIKTAVNNSVKGVEGEKTTEDYLFLLSVSEVDKYFTPSGHDNWLLSRMGNLVNNDLVPWWLRTQGTKTSKFAYCSGGGQLKDNGEEAVHTCGVRPAFWITLTEDIANDNHLSIGQNRSVSSSDIFVTVGSWDYTDEHGKSDGVKEYLEWEILEYDEDKNSVLLTTRYAIGDAKYISKYSKYRAGWDECELQGWLNTQFYNYAFTEAEKDLIKVSELFDGYVDENGKEVIINEALDAVFLLSLAEVDRYSGENATISRRCGHYDGTSTSWWVRNEGYTESIAACVQADGTNHILASGSAFSNAANNFRGVRPALRLSLGNEPETEPESSAEEYQFSGKEYSEVVSECYPALKTMADNGQIGLVTESRWDADVITLGKWDCDKYSEEDGYITDGKKEDLEWIVLEYAEDGKSALVLSKYVICLREYNDGETTWENCSLRNWLNDQFYEVAFSSSEKELIRSTLVVNEDYTYNRVITDGGNDTEDHLFLLSLSEFNKFFNVVKNGGHLSDDNLSDMRWWLRTPGESNKTALLIHRESYYTGGQYVYKEVYEGVRPAFWIDLTPEIIEVNHLSIGGYDDASKMDVHVLLGNCIDPDSMANLNYGVDFLIDDPLEWEILDYDEKNDRVLLMSRYAVDWKSYDDDDYYGYGEKRHFLSKWENCLLRRWLNEDFYNSAFEPSEQKLIEKVKVKNENYYFTSSQTYGFLNPDTEDRVFLLSQDELEQFFHDYMNEDIYYSDYYETVKRPIERKVTEPSDLYSGQVYPVLWLNLNP